MKEMKTTAQVLVDCLEAEGVDVMFGIPGEETLDLMFAIRDSKIRFIPVRHEQGAAFMAGCLWPSDRPGRRLPVHPWPRCHQPCHRCGGCLSGRCAAGGHHGPGRHRPDAQK